MVKLKTKSNDALELKAQIIRKYGTIGSFAEAIGEKPATVYAALKFRRNGRKSVAIRKAVT